MATAGAYNPGSSTQTVFEDPPPEYDPTSDDDALLIPPKQPEHAYMPVTNQGHYAYPAQTTVVVGGHQLQERPESYLVLSCCVYWCCNWIFGGIAFALSMASSSAADEHDYEKARRLGKASMCCSIAGIFITIVLVSIYLILYFFLLNNDDNNYGITEAPGHNALTLDGI